MTYKKQFLVASILDRLIDEDPQKKQEPLKANHHQTPDLYLSIQRDLENLLNTQKPSLAWPKEWAELNLSLLNYGIPNFMNHNLTEEEFRQQLISLIQQFEPRFKKLDIALIKDNKKKDRTLSLRIEGLIHAEPVPETIVLDTVLEPETQTFLVTKIN